MGSAVTGEWSGSGAKTSWGGRSHNGATGDEDCVGGCTSAGKHEHEHTPYPCHSLMSLSLDLSLGRERERRNTQLSGADMLKSQNLFFFIGQPGMCSLGSSQSNGVVSIEFPVGVELCN
jgi:hypothetical protein